MKSASLVFASLLALCACSPKPSDDASATSVAEAVAISAASEDASSAVASDVSAYVGKWTGPEGTSLTIAPSGDAYKVTVQNLDGPRDFTGKAVPEGIQFVRDGTPFVIHPGDGKATGMKWLVDKQNCLIVTTGEGYCRG